ncbi:apolipoprotein acyltransferase [Phycicoccus sp. BSK3Z-2]|uniref:Apolipoprotein acyltransferase n=1 Tax=Phycicoccus avicenniae TaxID=2828860 RepID=A0A941I1D4_9MICO|nr:nitrilase-related carbon-nitrogen hydrolase [Phycicoccus avicenniae]MBR7744186.1 apolipoprotein acyltransferase [Phycicoccus avicenniae]
MRVAAVQLSYEDAEPAADRVARAAGLVREHADHDLVVLPELWAPTGFGYRRWAEQAEPLDGPFAAAMADLARTVGTTLHAGSFVERLPEPGPDGNDLANTSLLFDGDGTLLAHYRKVHRFGFGSGEPRLMEAGTEVVVVDLPDGAGGTVRTGLSTCYDLRFPELYRLQQEAGAELFVVPAAWPAARVAHWTMFGRARAVENQAALVAVNTGGTHARTPMGGHTQVVTAAGEVMGELAHTDEAVLSVDLDLSTTAEYRDAFPVLADRRL